MKTANAMFLVSAGIIVTLFATLVILSQLNDYMDVFPARYSSYFYALVVALFLYVLIRIITRYLKDFLSKFMSPAKAHSLSFIASLVGYFTLTVSVFYTIGINVSTVILGSAFISLILGLAAQSVLANTFAGLMLILARPFSVGQRISVLTWQYGFLLSSYAPKYFSKDKITPSYSGKVTYISLNYTTLEDSYGNVVRIPNNVMIQASITLSTEHQAVQVRYEVPKTLKFEDVEEHLKTMIEKLDNCVGEPEARIDETSMTSYVILVRSWFRTENPEEVRSTILKSMIAYLNPLVSKLGNQ
ncbi:MAG: mechanosensitive ion channel family protein [Candidatus Thermoplasmatota archaeon]|jgi:small-conductance mechanosensitive channel|nr:mechanosensitive ion channel family protein [Candidatus Thermoplasmatota archaeon]